MPEQTKRESLELDVLFVGGGPASLAGAIHLADRVRLHNEQGGTSIELEIAVIEKGEEFGDHGFSGAILDPFVLDELLPKWREMGCPVEKVIEKEEVRFLTSGGSYRVPPFLIPPEMRDDGFFTLSLQKFVVWLVEQAEQRGINLFPGFTGVEVLYDGGRVVGVRTGDKGLDKDGSPKSNFEPGVDLMAKVTVFGEGPRGTLSEDLIERHGLRKDRNPQRYSLGVKEVIRVEGADHKGYVAHLMGYPLRPEAFGGGFLYEMGDGHIALGLVAGLDWKDPAFDCHEELQNLKKHPFVQPFIRGGEIVAYGAKTIPEGGYWSIPQVWTDGAMLIGDSAGLVDVKRLKGIPHGMKSGMLAADAAFEAIQEGDTSADRLKRYWDRLERSFVIQDLWKRRNFRRAFDTGLYSGMARMMFWDLTGGGSRQRVEEEPDFRHFGRAQDYTPRQAPEGFDNKSLSDKLTNVYRSGSTHREDQPSHIRILDPAVCVNTCIPRHGMAPCTSFCPAQVYELVEEGAAKKIQVSFTNCVHCKTCTILDPCDVDSGDAIQNIEWRAPAEGGPKYRYL